MSYRTDVRKNGTVLLSPNICCDGFDVKRKIRVQTHVHEDHMEDFSSSKGYQDKIILSNATRDLLIADKNADIPHRYNIVPLDYFKAYYVDDYKLELSPSNHMLGSVQTRVTHPDGYKVVYSSDFQLPLEHGVFECDELVIDSTCSNPNQKDCNKESIIKILKQKISELVSNKSVIITGYRGRLQYIMETIGNSFPDLPLIASNRPFKYANVYRKYGHPIRSLYKSDSERAKKLYVDDDKYILFIEPWESYKTIEENTHTILLSRFCYGEEPILDHSNNFTRIALSDHSGFNGTIKYIEESKCKRVITDSSRGGDGLELAHFIKSYLDIEVKPATLQYSKEWGI